jgi:sugar lactone lactonase YvrE
LASGYGGVAADANGNVYISYGPEAVVRKVLPDGSIVTVGGTGKSGYSGDNGPAIGAQLREPAGIAVDNDGNVYVADQLNSSIRKILPSGVIITVAGNGTPGYSGDGGPGSNAQLLSPEAVAVDKNGNIYIADAGNGLRKVSPDGSISTVVGNGTLSYSGDNGAAVRAQLSDPVALAVGDDGSLYIADAGNARVRVVSPAGMITTFAGGEAQNADGGVVSRASIAPEALALDAAGNLYVGDSGSNRIRRVARNGVITTVAGNGTFGSSGDHGIATAAKIGTVTGIAVDRKGNLYLSDATSDRIRKVSSKGIITTVGGNGKFGYSGDGRPALKATLNSPAGLAVDRVGNLYLADSSNHRVRKISAAGTITTVAGTGRAGYSGDGGLAVKAELFDPQGIAVDSAGNVYIADSGNNRIRKVTSAGIITSIAGNGRFGYSGDGGAPLEAQLGPFGLAVDAAGNIYVADPNNNAIRLLRRNGSTQRKGQARLRRRTLVHGQYPPAGSFA